MYFASLFGGYIPMLLLAGYIFLREENIWLRKAAFKAVALMLVFSACGAVISSVNDILGIFNSLFDWSLEIPLELDYVLSRIIDLVKVIMFAVLGFRAFSQGDVAISTIDKAISVDSAGK